MVVSAGYVVKVVGLTAVVLSAALPHGARANEAVAVPSAVANLVYDGYAKVGVPAGAGYTLVGNVATNAGAHVATATLAPGFVWDDGTDLPKAIDWTIAEPAYGRLYGWLETDGKGYILTDYVPKQLRTIVEISARMTGGTSDTALFCANKLTGGGDDWGETFYCHFDNDVTFENSKTCIWHSFTDTVSAHVFRFHRATEWIDGVSYTDTENAGQLADVEADGPLMLFGSKQLSGKKTIVLTELSAKRVYYVRIWEADGVTTNAVMDLVPATDRNGAATLYDRVSNTCLKPTNGGGFTCGEALDLTVAAPVAAEGLVADGTEKVGVPEGDGYELSGTVRASAPGRYEATATLKPGYFWEGGSKEPLTIAWSIADASNEWVTKPSVSKREWFEGGEPGVLTAGVSQCGEVSATITRRGETPQPFAGELPTAPGTYDVTYSVPATATCAGLSSTVTFAIVAPPARPPFDDAHTLVFYGDSLTEGDDAAARTNMDARANFFDGRLEGTSVKASFPYWVSGLVPSNYNVIAQAESGLKTREVLRWTGRMDFRTGQTFALPAEAGESVKLDEGALVYTVNGETRSDVSWWPAKSLLGQVDEGATFVGWLGDVRVRFTYCDDDWSYSVSRLTDGAAFEVPVDTPFLPDNLPVYGDAVQIFFTSANDHMKSTADSVSKIDGVLQTIEGVVTNIPSGRYLVISPHCNIVSGGETETQGKPTAYEQKFAAKFGEKYLNLRMAFVTNGVSIAKALGYSKVTAWNNRNNTTGLLEPSGGRIHFNPIGNRVVAQIVNEKLRALGYVRDGTANPFVNEKTGESYASASEAIDAAKAGETVRVASDPGSVDLVMKGGVSVDVGAFRESISFRLPSGVDWFDLPTAPTAAGGTVYKLNLNDRAKPVIEGAGEDRPALEVKDGKVIVRLANVKGGLYYALFSAESPAPDAAWKPVGDYELEKAEFTVDQQGDARFYKAAVTDLP